MTWSSFIMGLVGPITARILASLGFTILSLGGLTAAYATLKSQLLANVGSLPAAAVQLAGLFGIWQAIGIVLGSYVFVMSWKGSAGWWKFAKVNA